MKFFGIELSLSERKRQKAEATLISIREARQAEQDEIGLTLTRLMKEASLKNEVYNLYEDGSREEKIKRIVIQALPRNGQNFTVLSTLPSEGCSSVTFGVRGYPVHQVDINLAMTGKEIHLLNGPYGPDKYWSIDQLQFFKKLIAKEVREYTLFPKASEAI